MKVAATKAMATYINKVAKKNNLKAQAVPVKAGWAEVGLEALYDADQYGELDADNRAKAIKILFPYEYYACPLYFTTASLNREFKSRRVKTEEELDAMIVDLISI